MEKIGIVWLAEAEALDSERVGNKAAALAAARQRGYNVPNGFCVPVGAAEGTPLLLQPPLEAALQRLPPPWIARSSSTAEDSSLAAYPGLFKTVLEVSDPHSAMEAIRAVQASVDTDTVRDYAAHHRVDPVSIGMAVLIQALVIADSAGVAFSRDPVKGTEGVAIEANYGLGETVVDGSVIPDAYWVDSEGLVMSRRIGSKREKVVATTSGARLRRVDTSELEQSATVLTDAEILEVADVTRNLEKHLHTPVDVEWAFARGELFVLQARPITTLASTDA